jgi:hypothetical protein
MAKKAQKKGSAKPAKVKPELTEASAPEQPLRFKALQAPGLPKGPQGLPKGPTGLPEAIAGLEVRAERSPIAAEDRALLNRADRPKPSTPPPPHRRSPKQELCWQSFARIFTDGRMPDEAELSTVHLQGMIEADLKRTAKAGMKPPATPTLPTVTSARRNWPR